MQKVILESPYKSYEEAKFVDNYIYTLAVARQLILKKEIAPAFFHGLYTQFLDDNTHERDIGIETSFLFHENVEKKIFTLDRGISKGMGFSLEDALDKGIDIQFYTALPPFTLTGGSVASINKVSCVKERIAQAVALVEDLKRLNPEGFKRTGKLTEYDHYLDSEITEVRGILRRFIGVVVNDKRDFEPERCITR
ncbi:DUF7768 domain-containing protein [Photobacterium leiognathi]|uniref:DUF7768 domain-containing protein n=1 Tax=Photobacterium leiognathi TaxID=553611 RepID=UPI002981A2F0|nr:hypothetical protein [Photobacterium leiognathi]